MNTNYTIRTIADLDTESDKVLAGMVNRVDKQEASLKLEAAKALHIQCTRHWKTHPGDSVEKCYRAGGGEGKVNGQVNMALKVLQFFVVGRKDIEEESYDHMILRQVREASPCLNILDKIEEQELLNEGTIESHRLAIATILAGRDSKQTKNLTDLKKELDAILKGKAEESGEGEIDGDEIEPEANPLDALTTALEMLTPKILTLSEQERKLACMAMMSHYAKLAASIAPAAEAAPSIAAAS